jgi:glucose-1-phosphate cytidylyltransferase
MTRVDNQRWAVDNKADDAVRLVWGERGIGERKTGTMKVVIFCGGLGVRMGEEAERTPKPLISIGSRPILWHLMRWYAMWGFTEFVLCLGYRAESIKQYFLDYNEALGNDFVLSGRDVTLLGTDMEGWKITFLDTGVHTSIGDRLRAARPYVGDDDLFLCTYGDGLTDAPLDDMIHRLVESGRTGLFLSVRPRLSYHVVDADEEGNVRSIDLMSSADVRINGGFFVFRSRIFDEVSPGSDIMEVAGELSRKQEILAYRYDGFWAPMDTMKDKQDLDAIVDNGRMPWLVRPSRGARNGVLS